MFNFLESARFDPFTDWLVGFVVHQALIAPFLLLFLEESGIPLPIPGDVYVAFAGYQVSANHMPYWGAFLLLLLSVLAGSSILYYASVRWGRILVLKLGIYLHVNEKKLLQIENSFKKYGFWVIIFGRHIPGFRIPITIFSGISGVSYRTFIVSTFISVVFWIALYLSVGEKIGRSIVHDLRSNPYYFIFFIVPYLIFIISILYVKFKKKNIKSK
jgi:membrane protein DedA with SNARE-associated domain